jgi:acyl carrier protein
VGSVYNTYGPTETTVCAAYHKCPAGPGSNVPLGKPIANYIVYILDENGKLLPVGVPGELCISGPGVARGYLNRPELTAGKFNRSYESYRTYISYKTGDLARWRPDGTIEFLGRLDHQVKIRGYRIELEEIEKQLLKHREIDNAVVIMKEEHLFAYIVGGREFNTSRLIEYLAKELPGYMIPSYFVQMDNIPFTANGKVDRKALDLDGTRLGAGTVYIPPESDMEKNIAGIWQEVLKLDKVGIHENYFELGGTSFDIIRINERLKEVFEIDIPVVTMFRYTTVHSLANYLISSEAAGIRDRSAALERGKRDRMQRLRKRRGSRND